MKLKEKDENYKILKERNILLSDVLKSPREPCDMDDLD